MKKLFKSAKKIFRSPSLLISIFALLISGFSFYFQFFNIKHSIEYTALTPELKRGNIVVPVLFKNTGNQTEVLLNAELHLEVKGEDESSYKRISALNNKDTYAIFSPNDFKTIRIEGDYQQYMFGTLIFGENDDFKYSPITGLDELALVLQLTYLTKYGGVAEEARIIGWISFDENEEVSRIDLSPIELMQLDLSNNEREYVGYSIIPNYIKSGQISIDLTDSSSVEENIDKLQLMERIIKEQNDK